MLAAFVVDPIVTAAARMHRACAADAPRIRRRCSAHTPQMRHAKHRICPIAPPLVGWLGPCSPRAHSSRDSPRHCSGGLAGRATMCGYVVRGSRCEWMAATMTRRQ